MSPISTSGHSLVQGFSFLVVGGLACLLFFAPLLPASASPIEGSDVSAQHVIADTTAPVIVRPGAPGEPNRTVSERPSAPTYTQDDVDFMRGMILHHAQAIEMTEMVAARSVRQDVRQLAYRIQIGQADEMRQMMRWLENRDEPTPPLPEIVEKALGHHHNSVHDHHDHMHEGHDDMHHHHKGMHGMLSPAQLNELRAATGAEFDRLFLEFMIFHHEGALLMVDELFETDNAAQDSELYSFASHVEIDQSIEIMRMRQMLAQND